MADGAQVYVYYRVQPADAAAVIAAVHALQTACRARWPGLACTVARRADASGDDAAGPWTLMETYAQPGGVPPACRREIEGLALERIVARLVGPRHSEVFVPLDTPAAPCA